MKYTILIEKGKYSFGAYVPDIPGLMTVAKTKDVTVQLVREAIKQHIETLENDGKPLPESRTESESVDIE